MIVMRGRLVMAVVNIMSVNIMGVRMIIMLDGVAAGIAPMRADDRDDPREYRADQRQENDCLDHDHASLRMIPRQARLLVRESRSPLLRIMR
jgi:hypothetical protein